MIDTVKLKCFVELANTLNFSKTASRLFMTQQAVSKNIANLEKEWGIKLFQRNTRNVSLTPEGEELYKIVAKFTVDIADAVLRLRKGPESTTLRVGYQSYLMINDVVHDALHTLQESSPDITMDGNRYAPPVLNELLHSKDLDMIIIYERFLYPSEVNEIIVLENFPQYLMVAEDYPCETIEEVRKSPFIIDNFEGKQSPGFEDRINREKELFGLNPSEIIVVADRDSAYTYAELGRGVMIGAKSHLGSGRKLKRFETDHAEKLLGVWRKGEENALIKKYASLLIQGFKDKR